MFFHRLILVFAFLYPLLACSQPEAPAELRGVWLTNVDSKVLDSRASIAEAMQFLKDHHFNIVYPVVWNKAMTLYPSAVMDSLFGVKIDPAYSGRDPLKELIEEAHVRGIAVGPWFEFGFSSSYQENGGMILKKKPEWAAKNREGNLLKKNGFEWMNAYHPEVRDFLMALMKEVSTHYPVDGIQGDDRLPAQPSEGGYSEYTRKLYAAENGGREVPSAHDDESWLKWRADKLTTFATDVHEEMKAIDPALLVTWSPSIYPWSYEEYLQDWPAWIQAGAADVIHPQCYRYDLKSYKKVIDDLKNQESSRFPHLYPGVLMKVGTYTISPDLLLDCVQYHRKKGFHGEVFFFYEGLRENNDRLASVLLESFYSKPAVLPLPCRSQVISPSR